MQKLVPSEGSTICTHAKSRSFGSPAESWLRAGAGASSIHPRQADFEDGSADAAAIGRDSFVEEPLVQRVVADARVEAIAVGIEPLYRAGAC